MVFGVSKETITPSFPVKIACNGRYNDGSIGIHDDVFCRCLMMDDGNQKLIFLSYDPLFHDREPNNTLADYEQQKNGVTPSSFVHSCTHAHTAPACRGYNPNHHSDLYEAYLVEKGKLCIDKTMYSLFEETLEYVTVEIFRNCSPRWTKPA